MLVAMIDGSLGKRFQLFDFIETKPLNAAHDWPLTAHLTRCGQPSHGATGWRRNPGMNWGIGGP
jgi:hypothetical protein